jgi:hypothetical protein
LILLLFDHESRGDSVCCSFAKRDAGRYVVSLEATTDALLQPFQHTSLVEGSSTLADRLGATVNAMIGIEAFTQAIEMGDPHRVKLLCDPQRKQKRPDQ